MVELADMVLGYCPIASLETRGGELGVLRVREHPLNVEVHPLTAKSTPSKCKKT